MSAESIVDHSALQYPEYKEQYPRGGGLRLKFGDDVPGFTRSLKRGVKEEVREVNGSDNQTADPRLSLVICTRTVKLHIRLGGGACFHTTRCSRSNIPATVSAWQRSGLCPGGAPLPSAPLGLSYAEPGLETSHRPGSGAELARGQSAWSLCCPHAVQTSTTSGSKTVS